MQHMGKVHNIKLVVLILYKNGVDKTTYGIQKSMQTTQWQELFTTVVGKYMYIISYLFSSWLELKR